MSVKENRDAAARNIIHLVQLCASGFAVTACEGLMYACDGQGEPLQLIANGEKHIAEPFCKRGGGGVFERVAEEPQNLGSNNAACTKP